MDLPVLNFTWLQMSLVVTVVTVLVVFPKVVVPAVWPLVPCSVVED